MSQELSVFKSFSFQLKNLAFTIANTAVCLANVVLLGIFPIAVTHLGLDGIFLLFAFVCSLLSISSYFLMRETRGKSIEEIQKMFESGLLYRKE